MPLTSCLSSNPSATTDSYTLSLHDALPISRRLRPLPDLQQQALAGHVRVHRLRQREEAEQQGRLLLRTDEEEEQDRKSTRLNSSHSSISYAVFCLKKKSRC